MWIKKQQLASDVEQLTGSQLRKEYVKAVYCHPAYLTHMQRTSHEKARLDEAQAGIKIAGRNINSLRYADDTTLMAESEEELKNYLLKVKEESEKTGLELNIQKTKIVVSGPVTSWQIEGEKVKPVTEFIYLGFKTTEDGDCCHKNKRQKKSYGKPRQCIKKQRHHLVDKGPSSQGCGFSSSHVWM